MNEMMLHTPGLLLIVLSLIINSLEAVSHSQNHYDVEWKRNSSSYLEGNYASLTPVTLRDDEVLSLDLPFEFQFFDRRFTHAYLSSNGLVSFEDSPVGSRSDDSSLPSTHWDSSSFDHFTESNDRNGIELGGGSIIVLHRHLSPIHVTTLADEIKRFHESDSQLYRSFRAEIDQFLPHLKVIVVKKLSAEAMNYLVRHESVFHVHSNRKVSIDSISSFSTTYSWGLDRIDQPHLPLDNSVYTPPNRTILGAGVSVYVLDTGIDTLHVEFGSSGKSTREVRNIFNYFGSLHPNVDDSGHGTHCAGIAGGKKVGVAPGSNLYGVKVLDKDGNGDYASVLAGIEVVLGIRNDEPLLPMVASLSLSGSCGDEASCEKDALVLAMEELYQSQITAVVAAGNDYTDACTTTPGSSVHAVTVGATTVSDELASYSNWGSCVDIFAPGDNILSACSALTSHCPDSESSYIHKSGTSMATPHVAGVIALWLAQDGSKSPPTVSSVIDAIQCTSVMDALLFDSATFGPNLLLQVPPPNYSQTSEVTCDLDVGCKLNDANISCSGYGECIAGCCKCDKGSSGKYCDSHLPWWEYESFCCDGQDLSKNSSNPYNSIAFLWTDLSPQLGSVYYGSVSSGSAFIIVFDKVPLYNFPCTAIIEVVIHDSSRVDVILVKNEIGYLCSANNISIGIKGPPAADQEYEQLYGPSSKAPSRLHVTFTPRFITSNVSESPSLAPTVSATLRPTPHPTIDTLPSYNVSKLDRSESLLSRDYGSLEVLDIATDSYASVALPFLFNYFGKTYSSIFVSENGVLSFSRPTWSFCCEGFGAKAMDNSIAFLWSDLSLERGGVAYFGGVVNKSSVVLVFDQVNPEGYFCTATIEVELRKNGEIAISYLENSIGYSCGSHSVSVGISSSGASEFMQLYGPSARGMPYSETVIFTPTFNASQLSTSGENSLSEGGMIGIIISAVILVSVVFAAIYIYKSKVVPRWRHNMLPVKDEDEIVFSPEFEARAPLGMQTVQVQAQEEL